MIHSPYHSWPPRGNQLSGGSDKKTDFEHHTRTAPYSAANRNHSGAAYEGRAPKSRMFYRGKGSKFALWNLQNLGAVPPQTNMP